MNRFKLYFKHLAGQGIQFWISPLLVFLSLLLIFMTVLALEMIHEPSKIEILCPENFNQEIERVREMIENLN